MSGDGPPGPRARSAYGRALLGASWLAIVGVIACGFGVAWSPRLVALLPLQRTDAFKQGTGYVLVGLLAFGLALAWIKQRLVGETWLRALQLAHRVLGLTMLVATVFHAGFVHAGFLRVLFLVLLGVVAWGAVFDFLPRHRRASWGQWSTAVHILGACLLGALAVMHLHFVYAHAN